MIRPPMSRVVILAFAAVLATTPLGAQSRAPKPATTEAVLAAYLAGDEDAVQDIFKTSLDFQNRFRLNDPRQFDRWLGAFDAGKAVFVLALAETAGAIAPQYLPLLLNAGGRYVDGTPRNGPLAEASPEFARRWHRAAVSLLQGLRNGGVTEDHIAAIEARGRTDITSDARLLLARAVAHEVQCWASRPSLDMPSVQADALTKAAGMAVKPDLDGPTRIRNEAVAVHQACLVEAMTRFDRARSQDESRAEAGVRGGWVLIQQKRFQDALGWLDASAPGSDRVLGYWRSLFRGRALSGLNRHREAADAYRDAFTRFPGAQSAGVGLAFELLLLDQDAEADAIARSLRTTAATTIDPWVSYTQADRRFSDDLIETLRKQVIK